MFEAKPRAGPAELKILTSPWLDMVASVKPQELRQVFSKHAFGRTRGEWNSPDCLHVGLGVEARPCTVDVSRYLRYTLLCGSNPWHSELLRHTWRVVNKVPAFVRLSPFRAKYGLIGRSDSVGPGLAYAEDLSAPIAHRPGLAVHRRFFSTGLHFHRSLAMYSSKSFSRALFGRKATLASDREMGGGDSNTNLVIVQSQDVGWAFMHERDKARSSLHHILAQQSYSRLGGEWVKLPGE